MLIEFHPIYTSKSGDQPNTCTCFAFEYLLCHIGQGRLPIARGLHCWGILAGHVTSCIKSALGWRCVSPHGDKRQKTLAVKMTDPAKWLTATLGISASVLALVSTPAAASSSLSVLRDAVSRARRWSVDRLTQAMIEKQGLSVSVRNRTLKIMSANEVNAAARWGFSQPELLTMVLSSYQVFEILELKLRQNLDAEFIKAARNLALLGHETTSNILMTDLANAIAKLDVIDQQQEPIAYAEKDLQHIHYTNLALTSDYKLYYDEDCEIVIGDGHNVYVIRLVDDGLEWFLRGDMALAPTVTGKLLEEVSDMGLFEDGRYRTGMRVAVSFAKCGNAKKVADQIKRYFLCIEQVVERAKAGIAGALANGRAEFIPTRELLREQQIRGLSDDAAVDSSGQALEAPRLDYAELQLGASPMQISFLDYAEQALRGHAWLADFGERCVVEANSSNLNYGKDISETVLKYSLSQIAAVRYTRTGIAMDSISTELAVRYNHVLRDQSHVGILPAAQGSLYLYPLGEPVTIVQPGYKQPFPAPDVSVLHQLAVLTTLLVDVDGNWKEDSLEVVDSLIRETRIGLSALGDSVSALISRALEYMPDRVLLSQLETKAAIVAHRMPVPQPWVTRELLAALCCAGWSVSPETRRQACYMKICQHIYGASNSSRRVSFDRGTPVDGCEAFVTSQGVVYFPIQGQTYVAEISTPAPMTPVQFSAWLRSVEAIHLEIAELEGEDRTSVMLPVVRASGKFEQGVILKLRQ
jgi:hypothetical protein